MTRTKKQQLYRAVQAGAGWRTRRELAEAVGVKRLSSADALFLDLLAEEGRLEIEKTKRVGAIGFEYRYRITEEDGLHDNL